MVSMSNPSYPPGSCWEESMNSKSLLLALFPQLAILLPLTMVG